MVLLWNFFYFQSWGVFFSFLFPLTVVYFSIPLKNLLIKVYCMTSEQRKANNLLIPHGMHLLSNTEYDT